MPAGILWCIGSDLTLRTWNFVEWNFWLVHIFSRQSNLKTLEWKFLFAFYTFVHSHYRTKKKKKKKAEHFVDLLFCDNIESKLETIYFSCEYIWKCFRWSWLKIWTSSLSTLFWRRFLLYVYWYLIIHN